MSSVARASGSGRRLLLRLLPLALPLVLFVWTGLGGVDFGRHWDDTSKAEQLFDVTERECLLPHWYNYPSVTHWLCLGAFAPEYWRNLEFNDRGRASFDSDAALSWLTSNAFLIRTRSLFVLCTSLTLVWVYLLVLRWRGSPLEAFLAASLLGTSWEVAYHARWIAPDGPMMMFGALTALLVYEARQSQRSGRWLGAAALAAGLACGSKYTGGILLLVVLAEGLRSSRGQMSGRRVRGLVALCSLFAASFIVSTPGMLLEPITFYEDMRFELRHYSTGHMGFTVAAGADHLGRAVRYLAMSLASPYAPLAASLFLLAIAGAIATWRESRSLFLLLAGLPLLSLLYMSTQRVLFVRNLIHLAPFGAILATRGIGLILGRFQGRKATLVVGASCIALLVVDATWLVTAAQRIRERGSDRFLVELNEYITSRPKESFRLSPRVSDGFVEAGLELPPERPVDGGDTFDFIAAYSDEVLMPIHWPSNRPGLTEAVIGPREVNFEYYTSWREPPIVVLTVERYKEIAALLPTPE